MARARVRGPFAKPGDLGPGLARPHPKPAADTCGRGSLRSRNNAESARVIVLAQLEPGIVRRDGSDGARTLALRRDRPVLVLPS